MRCEGSLERKKDKRAIKDIIQEKILDTMSSVKKLFTTIPRDRKEEHSERTLNLFEFIFHEYLVR